MSQQQNISITVTVNGIDYTRAIDVRLLLSDFLRHELELTGTHVGCEHGSCGACTVMLDDPDAESGILTQKLAVRSCIMFAVQANGQRITTVEGLTSDMQRLHPLQTAFREKHGLQCGFCTPGFLMTLVPFLAEHPNPTEAEIRAAISGNICRCTGYQNIVAAVQFAAEALSTGAEQ
jgi:aerobic carbon-monoxide dehydrogenase small subunit